MTNENRDRRPLSDEEKAKLDAETQKIKDDNRRADEVHEQTLAKLKAETAKLDKETGIGDMQFKSATINYDNLHRQEQAALAQDIFHTTYFFTARIDEASVRSCIDRLSYWHRTKPNSEITIIFSSPGGSVWEGLQLYDYIQQIKRLGHVVITQSIGMSASMASILLQAGTIRRMTKESWVMIHEISTFTGGNASEIEDEAALLKRMQERTSAIFVEGAKRAKENGTASNAMDNIEEFTAHWKRKNWWLTSDECLEYGFVDEVI